MPSDAIKLVCSMATRSMLEELVSRYQPAAARPVTTEAAGGVEVAARVRAGEGLDVVVLASEAIDRLLAEGRLLAGSRVDLAQSGIAVAVRAGAATPDISTEAAVRSAVLAARTVGYSTGPSGVHLQALFERWGILQQIRARIIVAAPGIPVGSLLTGGKAELGFQQLSELMGVPGVTVVGTLPPAIQARTIFSGAIAARCSDPAAARALLDYLASPAGAPVKRRHGLDPLA
ncbi:MAG TPA: substrate-binding domain-containing protein [Steroidobacteraceae bacterium]|jgi:molybdate transport system substrate-binding protein|nr:substrate-binding domain-containing protein [Steroidobacteraceae bacterium]